MKRFTALLLCLFLLLPLNACGEEPEEIHTVSIGLFEPLTGDDALFGNQERLGVEFARTIKRSVVLDGVEYDVILEEEDTLSAIDGAVYAARKLKDKGVSLAIGSYGSSACSVAASVFEEEDIPVIAVSCTDETVTKSHPNCFRVCMLDSLQGKLLAQYAFEYGAKVAYCLAQTDRTYDRTMCNYFLDEFKALGGTVVTTVTEIQYNTYSTALNNFADYINGAVNNKTDILFSPIPPKKGGQLITECAASDVKFSILGDDTWDDDSLGEYALGTYMYVSYAALFAEDRDDSTKEFSAAFRDWLHADEHRIEANGGTDKVSPASALAYDAYMTACAAMESAGSTEPAAVLAAMKTVNVNGVTGNIVFDEFGDAARTELFLKHVDTATGEIYYEKTQMKRYEAPPAEDGEEPA